MTASGIAVGGSGFGYYHGGYMGMGYGGGGGLLLIIIIAYLLLRGRSPQNNQSMATLVPF